MNMFSSKCEVEEHVAKILSICKNQHDKDRQCFLIGKLYFDVKEYQIAKTYIDSFIKMQGNSQEALKLKAKIHENLSEFDLAANYYEHLYDLFPEETYITKASECMIKTEKVNEVKLKKYVDILEKYPNNEIYLKLKKLLSPNASFTYSIDEINNLKNQIKSSINYDLKIQFLRILESQNGVVDSLHECKIMMDTYTIFDNIDAVKICVSIFQKHFKPEQVQFKHHYCFILIALLRNYIKICNFDCVLDLLLDLLNLLKDEVLEDTNKEIFQQFVYYLSSIAHYQAIKDNNLTNGLILVIYKGYLISNSIDTSDLNQFSPSISTWLRGQISLIRSITTHMIAQFDQIHIDIVSNQCILELIKLIWKTKHDIPEISVVFSDNFKTSGIKIKSVVEEDLQCLSQHFNDLKLIGWQMACYNDFRNKSRFKYQLEPVVYSFIGTITRKLFSKLPTDVTSKRSPENICKIDLISFLLGTFLTYQKSFNSIDYSNSSLPYPFEMWEEIRIPEVLHKWWQAACDFTLLNKRNTSIGALKDLLKSGLDSLQLVDNQMSEILKLQLGKLIIDCSNCLDSERNSLKKRGISFYSTVLQPEKLPSSFKNLPITEYSTRRSINCQKNFMSLTSAFNGFKTKELFDTDHLLDNVIGEWKLDAYLVMIDWYLQQPMANNADFNDVEQLVELAEKLNSKSFKVHYMKSRVYLWWAQSIQSKTTPALTNKSNEFNKLLKLAQDSAHEAMNYLNELEERHKSQMHDNLQQLLNDIVCVQSGDYSIFELNCIGKTSNSNKCYNQSIVSNDDSNELSISTDQSTIDGCKLEELQTDIIVLCSTQEKIDSEINLCLNQVDNVSKFVGNELSLIKENIKCENEQKKDFYLKLLSKIDNLTIKTDRLELKAKTDEKEMECLKKNVDLLAETVNNLTIENNYLKNEIEIMNFSSNMAEKVIHPEMNKISTIINNSFETLYNNANKQVQQFEIVKLMLQTRNTTDKAANKKYNWQLKTKSELDTVVTDSQSINSSLTNMQFIDIDLSKLNQSKWECSTCLCMNEDNATVCLTCKTSNPKVVIDENSKTKFHPSKVIQNKWICSNCKIMNDNSTCSSCLFNKSSINSVNSIKYGMKTIDLGPSNSLSNTNNTFSKYVGEEVDMNFDFGKDLQNSDFMEEYNEPNFCKMSNCESTNELKTGSKECIGFDAKNNSFVSKLSDNNVCEESEESDVIFVGETFVTEEQIARARLLKLPDHFYSYENISDNSDSSEQSNIDNVV